MPKTVIKLCLYCHKPLLNAHWNTHTHKQCRKPQKAKMHEAYIKRERLLKYQIKHQGAALPCEEYRVNLPNRSHDDY